MRYLAILMCLSAVAVAETRTMTLKQAVALAMEQSPELMLARLDQQKSETAVKSVAEPFLPRVYAGSGLAYTYGFPVSIDGSAPSIVQARAERTLYNSSQRLFTAEAREHARAAAMGTAEAREEVGLRTAVLFLDLERAARGERTASAQASALERVEAAVRLRVAEARELAIEGKRAAVNLARARQRRSVLAGSKAGLSRALAGALGLEPGVEIEPALEERGEMEMPESARSAAERAVKESRELRRLESEILAHTLAARGHRAMRRPSVNLVAQYSLLGKFNNYEEFFRRFQRHNAQIGASVVVPLFANPQDEARAAAAELEARKLRVRAGMVRAELEAESLRRWQRVADAEAYKEVAKMDLELAREMAGVLLARQGEGRASARDVEQARAEEQAKWAEYDEASYEVERARLELLKTAGSVVAALN